jgi:adenine-specific DNA-methyltransferase
MLKRILQVGTKPGENALVLDFFAGSGSMSHATFALNAEDGGNRRAIAVQIAEPLDLPEGTAPNLDTGFRVLKIDTSNMRDVYYAPDALAQGDLLAHVDNIRPDRAPEDLLFQVLVDWGLDLALPIAQETIAGKSVFFVDGNALAACFDPGITDELVKEVAKRKPLRAVFRDSSYGSDSVKINVDQIFRLLSPDTEVRSI